MERSHLAGQEIINLQYLERLELCFRRSLNVKTGGVTILVTPPVCHIFDRSLCDINNSEGGKIGCFKGHAVAVDSAGNLRAYAGPVVQNALQLAKASQNINLLLITV